MAIWSPHNWGYPVSEAPNGVIWKAALPAAQANNFNRWGVMRCESWMATIYGGRFARGPQKIYVDIDKNLLYLISDIWYLYLYLYTYREPPVPSFFCPFIGICVVLYVARGLKLSSDQLARIVRCQGCWWISVANGDLIELHVPSGKR